MIRRVATCWVAAVAIACTAPSPPPAEAEGEEPSAGAVGAPVAATLDGADADVAASIRELLEAARAAPQDGSARGRLGMAYEVATFNRAALESYRQAEALDPDEPRWSYYRAMLEALLGDPAAAVETMGRSIRLDPDYLPAYLHRATWLLDLGRGDEALADLDHVESVEPGNPAATMARARVLLNRGEPGEALARLDALAARVRHPYIQQLRGRALRDMGRLDEALAVLKAADAGSKRPGWPDPRHDEKAAFKTGFGAELMQAGRMMAKGQTDEAIALLEGLHERRPGDVATTNNLAVAYMSSGRLDRAEALLERSIQRSPGYFPFRLNLAEIYTRQRRVDDALEQLDRALELNPTLAQAHEQKGTLLMRTRRLSEALAAYESAALYDARNPRPFLNSAIIEQELDNYVAARDKARQAIAVQPGLGAAHYLVAMASIELGDWAEAERALQQARAVGFSAQRLDAADAMLNQRRGNG